MSSGMSEFGGALQGICTSWRALMVRPKRVSRVSRSVKSFTLPRPEGSSKDAAVGSKSREEWRTVRKTWAVRGQ